jgi:uncharacterized membrane protein YphA (DoxX/SURF4 family)
VEDKPSILAAFVRIAVGVVFAVAGSDKFTAHASNTADFRRWGLPSPSAFAYAIGSLEIVCGVLLVLGLVPRLAGLLLACDMVGALLTAGRTDGGIQWAAPSVLLLFLLIVIGSGGGRWALIDRLDPAPPRRLARE